MTAKVQKEFRLHSDGTEDPADLADKVAVMVSKIVAQATHIMGIDPCATTSVVILALLQTMAENGHEKCVLHSLGMMKAIFESKLSGEDGKLFSKVVH